MPLRYPMLLLALCLGGVACTPSYAMSVPPSFKKYEDTRDFALISAEGVMVKAREVENYPKAELAFWVDAMKRHLDERGYVLTAEKCFDAAFGRKACTLDFALPHGAEDWVMSETVFVVDDRVVLVEAAAPFERFQAVRDELARALATFDPGQ